ncbi:MAG TPA: SOS response-associated peptidase family protein [Burkholderiales bacterium]
MGTERVVRGAGLWENWFDAEEKRLETFTILTTEANGFMHNLDERMPVVVKSAELKLWLNPTLAKDDPWLKPYPDECLGCHPVSFKVNSMRNDDESLLAAVPVTT